MFDFFKKIIAKKSCEPTKGFFVHIPKTAGTSFRKGLEHEVNVVTDYPKTQSEMVKRVIYDKKDKYGFFQELKVENSWLAGHVSFRKYSSIYSPLAVCTFLRDPVEQVISHYNHFVTHSNYNKGLRHFIGESRFCNVQSKYLSGVPIELLGCVGIQENYSESLDMINHHFNLNLCNGSSNVNNSKTVASQDLDKDLLDLVLSKNRDDVNLYQKAKLLFTARYEVFAHSKYEWVHGYYSLDGSILSGIAYFSKSETPVDLELEVKGVVIEKLTAKESAKTDLDLLLPRLAHVAFSADLSAIGDLNSLMVYVSGTRQQLKLL